MINQLLRICILGLMAIGAIYLVYRSLFTVAVYDFDRQLDVPVVSDEKVPSALDSLKQLKRFSKDN